VPFDISEFHQKTGRKSVGQHMFPTTVNTPGITEVEKPSVVANTKKGADTRASAPAPSKKSVAPSSTASQDGSAAPATRHLANEVDKQLYLANQSFVSIKLAFHRPLIPKNRRAAADFCIKNIVEPRPSSTLPNDNGFLAIQQYREEVRHCYEIAASLFNKESKKSKDWVQIYENIEKEMHTSGELCSLRERIRRHILRIVRDRFYRVKPFDDEAEYQGFLSELYADLVREIHLTCHPAQQKVQVAHNHLTNR